MPNRTIEILLKAGVDKSTATQGVRALQEIQRASEAAQASMLSLGGEPARVANQYKALGDVSKLIRRELDIQNIAQQYYTLGQIVGDDVGQLENLRRTMKEVGASSDEIDRATRAFQELQAQAKGSNQSAKGLSVEGFRRTGGAIEQLLPGSGIGAGIQRIGDLGQIGKEFNQLKDILASVGNESSLLTGAFGALGGSTAILAAAIIPLTAAVALFAGGIKIFNDAVDDGKKRLDSALSTQKTFYDFLATGTTEAAKQQVESLEKQSAAQKAARDETERALKSLEGQTGISRGVGIAAPAALGDAFRTLTKQLDENNKAVTDSENLIGRFNGALQSNAFAANDAAEAEAKLQAARDKAAEEIISSTVRRYQLEQTASSKQLEDRLGEIAVENAALEKEAQYTALHTDAENEAIAARIKALDGEKQDIEAIQGAVKAREDEADATKAVQEAVKVYQSTLNDYTSALKQAGQAQGQIAADTNARALQLQRRADEDAIQANRKQTEEDYRDRIAEAKKNAVLDKLSSDYFASELKALGEFHDQEAKTDSKSAKDRLHLLEDASDDLFSAAANNDVVAFLNRQRQADKDLRRQKEDADDAEKDRIDAYLKEREQARAQYEEQYKIQEDAGNARNDRAAQLEQELNNIREQWRIDDINRQRDLEEQDFQQRMALAQARYSELLALADSYFQALKSSFENANPGTTLSMSSQGDLVFTEQGSNGQPISRLAGGTPYIPYDKFPAYLDQGERVLTKQQNQEYTSGKSGGSKVYSISIQNTVGDIATKSMLDQSIIETVTQLTQELENDSDG